GTLISMAPAADWVTSPYGYALDFDGDNDHVTMGDVLDFRGDEPFSAFCWVKFAATPVAYKSFIAK
ncbi:unnamed protein product, partial [marine sediment metagenome]